MEKMLTRQGTLFGVLLHAHTGSVIIRGGTGGVIYSHLSYGALDRSKFSVVLLKV